MGLSCIILTNKLSYLKYFLIVHELLCDIGESCYERGHQPLSVLSHRLRTRIYFCTPCVGGACNTVCYLPIVRCSDHQETLLIHHHQSIAVHC